MCVCVCVCVCVCTSLYISCSGCIYDDVTGCCYSLLLTACGCNIAD